MQGRNSPLQAVKSSGGMYVHPGWTLCLPLLSLTAIWFAPPELRMMTAFFASCVFCGMQWLAPQCRFRNDALYSPQNIATMLLLTRLIFVPALIMVSGPTIGVLPQLVSREAMEWALAIDLIAYVAFCLGLNLVKTGPIPARTRPLLDALSTIPTRSLMLTFLGLGIAGFVLNFGSPARLLEYFTNPLADAELNRQLEGSWAGFFGTILRPFVAVALVAMWSRQVDRTDGQWRMWKVVGVGAVTGLGILIANLTFDFNRAAFIFPLVSLAGVYSARIKRISPWMMVAVAAVAAPLLISIATYRSSSIQGAELLSTPGAVQASLDDLSEHIQTYTSGQQFTGFFYEKIGWGDKLLGGSSLIASVLSPVPILGKNFRTNNGPAIYNRAIYDNAGFEDQIIPFDTELFLNFHVLGVAAGFLILGLFLGSIQRWQDYVSSTFGAFALQYAGLWGAMLTVWSLSVYSQILVYFFLPFYTFVAFHCLRAWLRNFRQPNLASAFAEGELAG